VGVIARAAHCRLVRQRGDERVGLIIHGGQSVSKIDDEVLLTLNRYGRLVLIRAGGDPRAVDAMERLGRISEEDISSGIVQIRLIQRLRQRREAPWLVA